MEVFNVILCVALALAGYFFVRNFYVMKFGSKIIDLCYKHNLRRIDETWAATTSLLTIGSITSIRMRSFYSASSR